VTGNLTIAASSNSVFNGIIYVRDGNCQIDAPAIVRGAIVGNLQVHLIGSGDYVEVDYDPDVLAQVLQTLGQYRFSKPTTAIE